MPDTENGRRGDQGRRCRSWGGGKWVKGADPLQSLDPGDSCAVATESLLREGKCQRGCTVLITTDWCPKLHTEEAGKSYPEVAETGTLYSSGSLFSRILCWPSVPGRHTWSFPGSTASPLAGNSPPLPALPRTEEKCRASEVFLRSTKCSPHSQALAPCRETDLRQAFTECLKLTNVGRLLSGST